MTPVLRRVALTATSFAIAMSARAQDDFVFWPDADYDPAIPTFESVLGYAPGEQITWHRDAIRYFEALAAAAPDRIAVQPYATTWEGRDLVYAVVTSAENMARVLGSITPTLDYDAFGTVDLVVEAVVENEGVKKKVLAECEGRLPENAIITSNTSTISITRLAESLSRPENFCGMHFFNPVHRMPLVEVIRGEKSSEAAIATTVAYARVLKKTPIVVRDCPGFLVNRVLFPYFEGFNLLMRDGADMQTVDRVMQKFGWPMGPAYLLDVVGIDVAAHAGGVMAEGFPDRMQISYRTVVHELYERGRYGQKSGAGFYRYEQDKRGRPVKTVDPDVSALMAEVCGPVGLNS